jgi:pilus assembly protein CpaB
VRNRVLGAVAALLLAALGTALVMMYVGGAEERAFAGVETTPILIVTQPVPAGTPADIALQSAELQELPARAVAADAVVDGAAVADLVTTVDLVVGEQLLSSRFASPEKVTADEAIEVPTGEQELSISLDAERTVGGQLVPGDTVGVFISIGNGTEQLPSPEFRSTGFSIHKVLVTNIQSAPAPPAAEPAAEPTSEPIDIEDESTDSEVLPIGELMFTFSVTAEEAEKIVWGREFGTLWLSREPANAIEDGTRVITRENVLQ